jgi:hypothetical protein
MNRNEQRRASLKESIWRATLWAGVVWSLGVAGYAGSDRPFPDTAAFIVQVAERQKQVESQFDQYTCTDSITMYTLDKNGRVRGQHADTYYLTPTPYELFVLHVNHDGQAVSKKDLQKQQEQIEHKLRRYEQKAEKPGALHPKEALLFGDIIEKSRFTPLRWEERDGRQVMVYAFEAKAAPERKGDLNQKVAGDMKGKMWINVEEAEIERIEFASISPISLGLGLLGSVNGFEGFVEQKKVHGEIWLPSHEEFVASGRQFVSGFRVRQVSEYTDFLKATTDVFQQVHLEKTNHKDDVTATQSAGESHE